MSKKQDTLTQAETRRLAKFCGLDAIEFVKGDCFGTFEDGFTIIFDPLTNCADLERVETALEDGLFTGRARGKAFADKSIPCKKDENGNTMRMIREQGPTHALAVCRLALAVIKERAEETKGKVKK